MTDSNRRSKMLTQTLVAKYLEAQNDPELLSNRIDLSLLEVRLSQLLARIDQGDRPDAWQQLRFIFEDYKRAVQSADQLKVLQCETAMEQVFEDREKDYAAWSEIYNLLEQRRKLGESEQKRLVAMNQMITSEDAMKLVGQLLTAIKKNVGKPPEEFYAAVSYEFAIIAGDANRTGIQIGSGESVGADRPPGVDQ